MSHNEPSKSRCLRFRFQVNNSGRTWRQIRLSTRWGLFWAKTSWSRQLPTGAEPQKEIWYLVRRRRKKKPSGKWSAIILSDRTSILTRIDITEPFDSQKHIMFEVEYGGFKVVLNGQTRLVPKGVSFCVKADNTYEIENKSKENSYYIQLYVITYEQ